MRIEDLEALLATADAGSVTGAARALGCSQSMVSRRIQRLEQDLGAAVFTRGVAGVRLTSAGERALAFAHDTVGAYAALRARIRGEPTFASGHLHVAASTTPGEHLAPTLIARFADRHPQARPHLQVADTAAVYEALLARSADVGFVGHRAAASEEGLTFVAFAPDEVVLAVHVDHRLSTAGEIETEDLTDERLIAREVGSGTQRTFFDALARAGQTLPATTRPVSLGSTQAVISAVAAGMGIGIVSSRAIDDHRPRRLAAIRLRGLRMTRSLWLTYETRRVRTPLQAAFIAYASDQALPSAAGHGDVRSGA